jgi:acid phosphatase
MRRLPFIALLLVVVACATTPPPPAAPPPCRPGDAAISSTLWEQTAAEYLAITREVYGTARRNIDAALADPSWSALDSPPPPAAGKPAVILDVDETVLDTSSFQGDQIKSGTGYNEDRWHAFALGSAAVPIDAARDFLNEAERRGVAIFYVTNRKESEGEALARWLGSNGYPAGTRLMRADTTDKTPRRISVGSQYRVIMLFGDDLNDFAAANSLSVADRAALVRANADRWGKSWYILPNPTYDSWERALVAGIAGDCAQLRHKIDLVRTSSNNDLRDALQAALRELPQVSGLVASAKLSPEARAAAASLGAGDDMPTLPPGTARVSELRVDGDTAAVTLWLGSAAPPPPKDGKSISMDCGTGYHFALRRTGDGWTVENRGVAMC